VKAPIAAGAVLLACLGLAVGGLITEPSSASAPFEMTDFSQTGPQALTIQLDRVASRVHAVRFEGVPATLDGAVADGDLEAELDGTIITLNLDEDQQQHEYSILVEITACPHVIPISCDEPDYVEIVRQPASWLEDTFGFDRRSGYSILGRHSVVVGDNEPQAMPPLTFVDQAAIDVSGVDLADLPNEIAAHEELRSAAAIIRMIWATELRGGPTNLSYDEYLSRPFDDKLAMVREGRTAVMCQGVRDLFLHASSAFPNLRTRAVEALNYSPSMPDLVSYGHSTAEVWVESLQKWVLVDPWLGIVPASSGAVLSASEMTGNERVQILPLLPQISRFATAADGTLIRTVVVPAQLSLDRYSSSPIGHAPGYGIYFNSLSYRQWLVLQDEGN
jgi:hypothetical protein